MDDTRDSTREDYLRGIANDVHKLIGDQGNLDRFRQQLCSFHEKLDHQTQEGAHRARQDRRLRDISLQPHEYVGEIERLAKFACDLNKHSRPRSQKSLGRAKSVFRRP